MSEKEKLLQELAELQAQVDALDPQERAAYERKRMKSPSTVESPEEIIENIKNGSMSVEDAKALLPEWKKVISHVPLAGSDNEPT